SRHDDGRLVALVRARLRRRRRDPPRAGRRGGNVRRFVGCAALLGLTLTRVDSAAGDPMHYDPSPIEQAYRAGKAAGDDDAARVQYQRGIDLARGVLARTPDQPDALLWLSANLAGEALTHGKLRALRVIPEIERALLRLETRAPLHS